MIILISVLASLAAALACEHAEQKSRRYYTDQWLLRGSGFFFGCAITLAVAGIVFS